MDIEERQLLKDVKSLLEDNHKMLKKMRRAQAWSSTMRAIYWLIILGVAFGSFYYIQPYVEQMRGLFESVGEITGNVSVPLPGF